MAHYNELMQSHTTAITVCKIAESSVNVPLNPSISEIE